MSDPIRVLYVDDYPLDRELVRDALEREQNDFSLTLATSRADFETRLAEGSYDLVLSDFNILGFEGLQVLEAVHAVDPRLPVVIVTGTGSEEVAVEAMKRGAADYIIKTPSHIQRLPYTIRSVLEMKRLEASRDRAEQERDRLFNYSLDLFGIAAFDGRIIQVNPAWEKILGWTSDDLAAKPWRAFVHPDDVAASSRVAERLLAGETVLGFESRYGCKDGSFKWISWNVYPLAKEKLIFIVARDITDRKQAEEERERLQAQLIQAQKMETIGRLAGGVAHDFNNMLGVILGHAELAMEDVGVTQAVYSSLQEIRKAAQRSADLTRQLLAFARKQTINPQVLELNETVTGMLKMLQRLIGENIELVWRTEPDVWPVKMDPTQLDQILVNLCVNARDAIAGVGEVVIEARNITFGEAYYAAQMGVAPGEYVLLSVSDNGCGMDQATQNHLFEPFFTTKGVGKGTGLGLATVYGVVKQNSGYIGVRSEPGKGTTFDIYLPRYAGRSAQAAKGSVEQAAARGQETVLLVEDEPTILRIAQIMLQRSGYHALTASTPSEAVRVAEEQSVAGQSDIHLLITDMVMPEMNGCDLARKLQTLCPRIKTLFMSGYAGDMIDQQGAIHRAAGFIQKPFSFQALTAKVREVLDQK